MAIKKNTVKYDLRSYPPYLIMGEKKIGKTTLFHDLTFYNFKSYDKGLLISFKDEEGYHALNDITFERINEWDKEEDENGERGFVQLVDDLIENKETLGFEMICLDTLDKLVDIGIQEVLDMHRRLKGSYPESINGALGGYGNGSKKVVSIIQEQIGRLKNSGYAVFILAHTKRKDKTDIFTGEDYEQITNNLMSTYYNPIADSCQMIVNIIPEREYSASGTVELDKDGKPIGQRNRVSNTKRMMYFRDCSVVDAGTRFADIPEKLELSAENFMEAFKYGVKASSGKNITDEEFAKIAEKEEKELKERVKLIQESEKNKKKENEELEKKREMFSLFQQKATKLDAEQLNQVTMLNKEYGITAKEFKNVELIPMELLEKYLEVIK